jgi:succinate dehydrogenase / fumarate reductase membrane anchor subunit
MSIFIEKYPFGGMTQWIYQRFTAIYMIFYFLLLGLKLYQVEINYDNWLMVMSPLWMRIVTIIFFYFMLFHAWIGVQHVIEDYIQSIVVRKLINLLFLLLVVGQLVILPYFLFGVVSA